MTEREGLGSTPLWLTSIVLVKSNSPHSDRVDGKGSPNGTGLMGQKIMSPKWYIIQKLLFKTGVSVKTNSKIGEYNPPELRSCPGGLDLFSRSNKTPSVSCLFDKFKFKSLYYSPWIATDSISESETLLNQGSLSQNSEM